MNRRSFLSAFAALSITAAIDPEVLIWTPKLISVPSGIDFGNRFVTIEEITRQTLLVLRKNLVFHDYSKNYSSYFDLTDSQIEIGETIRMPRPPRYRVRIGGL